MRYFYLATACAAWSAFIMSVGNAVMTARLFNVVSATLDIVKDVVSMIDILGAIK